MKVVEKAVVGSLNVWFPERGYGFIHVLRPDGTISRHFLHSANITSGVPVKGAIVRFDSIPNPKGSLCANAEIFANRKELERADAAAALVDSTTGGAK